MSYLAIASLGVIAFAWYGLNQQARTAADHKSVDVPTVQIDYDKSKILVDDTAEPIEIIDITKPQS